MNKYITKGTLASVILLFAALIYNYPLFILLINSLKDNNDYLMNPFGWPNPIVFENLMEAFIRINFLRTAFNTIIITIIVVAFLVVFSSMTAFAIVRRSSRFTKAVYILLMGGILIPFQVYMIPLVRLYSFLGILRTPTSLVLSLIAGGTSLSVFLFCSYLKTVPKELEEAATIDGCNPYQLFFMVIFPIIKPCVTMVTIFFGLSTWNSFIQPLVLIGGGNFRMLFIEISLLMSRPFTMEWNLIFAACVLAMLPLLLLYVFLQDKIIGGLVAGSLKG